MFVNECKEIFKLITKAKIHDSGLFYGKMGLSLFAYSLAKELSDDDILNFAESQLFDIYKTNTLSIQFIDGLTGIGWGIEYLVQNGYCEGDTNEVLKEIDSKLFKYIVTNNSIRLTLPDGYIGYLQYVMMRIQGKKSDIIVMELYKYILNKIDSIAPEYIQKITQDTRFNLFDDTFVLMWSLASFLDQHLYEDKILNMFKQWLPFLLLSLPYIHFNRLYLALILEKIDHYLHIEEIKRHICILLYSVDVNKLIIEQNVEETISIRFGGLGQLLILDNCLKTFDVSYPNIRSLDVVRRKIIGRIDKKINMELKSSSLSSKDDSSIEYGLVDGWCGCGMLLLLINKNLKK